jgi:hypothetical protein
MNKIVVYGTAGAVATAALLAGVVLAQNAATAKLGPQDLLDIRQLIDAYPHLLDSCVNNGNDYADLYTPDATFGVSQEYTKAKIWFRGREQLRRAGGGTDTACRPSQSQGHAYHLNINPTITATPTGAHATSTLLTITNDTNSRGDIVHWEGGYEDTFEKTPAGWKFKSRVHVWPEVAWTDRVEDMPQRKLEDE